MYLFFPLLILVAQGLLIVWDELLKRKLLFLFPLLVLPVFIWNFGFFIKQYWIHTKYETTQHRSYGYKQLFAKTEAYKKDYEQIYIYENIDAPHIFYLFYTQFPPKKYQKIPNQNKRDLFSTNKPIMKLDQYFFHPGSCPTSEDLPANTLYVYQVGCHIDGDLQKQFKIIDRLYSADGSPLFYISTLID
jgi:hypothetical protein